MKLWKWLGFKNKSLYGEGGPGEGNSFPIIVELGGAPGEVAHGQFAMYAQPRYSVCLLTFATSSNDRPN